jgi:hypothetical protein
MRVAVAMNTGCAAGVHPAAEEGRGEFSDGSALIAEFG